MHTCCSGHSLWCVSVVAYIKYLNYLLSLTIYIYRFYPLIFLTINPNPPCQLSLWEETGEHAEKAHNFQQGVDERLFVAVIDNNWSEKFE